MKKIFRFIFIFALFNLTIFYSIFYFFDKISPLYLVLDKKPLAKIIYDKNGNILRHLLSKDGYWRFEVTPKDIPKFLKKSIISFEDKYFYYHFGINPFSIFRAVVFNSTHKNRIGASTITMQVARMLERKERSYISKFLEILRAIQLEKNLSKDEILTLYFNLAPYGGNVEGVRAASYFYFNKSLKNLSISEMAILTTIPKNPNLNRPDKQKNLKIKRDKVLANLLKQNVINKSAYNRALLEKISAKRYEAIYQAQHFTNLNYFKNQKQTDIKTTIDLGLQLFLEKLLNQEIAKYSLINNSSAVVLDNKDNSIIAYVGSNNFYDKINGGQNNGVEMIRSPGSTLKPFIYALSFDEGLITPKKILLDIPLNFAGYIPKNYDNIYRGLIESREALKQSLNSVVIDMNNNLGSNSLYELLIKAQIGSINKDKKYYGLSIALGGVGVSLLDLVRLYSSFSHDGELREVKFIKSDQDTLIAKLFSKNSAFVISEILADGYRKELSLFWDSAKNAKKIAFKTGTSADNKDLFTIGYTKNYTVGIWMGNFNSSSTGKNFTGISTASLALFATFNYINKKDELKWFKKPQDLKQIMQCLEYVDLPNCKKKEFDYMIAKKSKCFNLNPLKINYLLKKGIIDDISQLQNNSCYFEIAKKKPKILNPQKGVIIYSSNKIPLKYQKIKINCFSYKSDKTIYLNINNQKNYTLTSNQAIFVDLPKGENSIICMDSKGDMDKINFMIE